MNTFVPLTFPDRQIDYCTKAIVTHAAQSVAIRIFSFGSLRTIVRAIATNAANAIMIFVVANNFPVLATM